MATKIRVSPNGGHIWFRFGKDFAFIKNSISIAKTPPDRGCRKNIIKIFYLFLQQEIENLGLKKNAIKKLRI